MKVLLDKAVVLVMATAAIALGGCADSRDGGSGQSDLEKAYADLVKFTSEDFTEEEREALYRYRNKNEPRITLAPDLPGYFDDQDHPMRTDEKLSYGLIRTHALK